MRTTISNDDAMPTLTFRLPSALKERLQQHATKDGKPATTLAREWLAQRLEQLGSGTATPSESGSTTAPGQAKDATDPAILNALRDLLTAVHASAEESRTALRMHHAMMRQLTPEILGTLVMVLWLVQNIYGEWRDAPISEVTSWVRTERARRVQELFERAEKAAHDGVS